MDPKSSRSPRKTGGASDRVHIAEIGVELLAVGDTRSDGRAYGPNSGSFRYVYVREVGTSGEPSDHRFKMYDWSTLDDSLGPLFEFEVEAGCRHFSLTVSTRDGESDPIIERASPGIPIYKRKGKTSTLKAVATQAPVVAKSYVTRCGSTQVLLKIPKHLIAEQMFPNGVHHCYVHTDEEGDIVVMPSDTGPNSTFEWGLECKGHVTAYLKGVTLGEPSRKGLAPELGFVMKPYAQGMKLCSAFH